MYPKIELIITALQGDFRQTVTGCFWILFRYKRRGLNLLLSAASKSKNFYGLWIRRVEHSLPASTDAGDLVDDLRIVPFMVAEDLPAANSAHSNLKKVFGQACADDQLIVHLSGSGARSSLLRLRERLIEELARSDVRAWLLPWNPVDALAPEAATWLRDPCIIAESRLVFWDEDKIVAGKRTDPWLKPDWDRIMFSGTDYLTGASMLEAGLALQAVDAILAADPDEPVLHGLVNVAAAMADDRQIAKVPRILTHRASAADWPIQYDRGRFICAALKSRLMVNPMRGPEQRMQADLPAPAPSVSIIIPTRDKVDLLRTCIEKLHEIQYPGRIEIIVVDNDSIEQQTITYLEELDKAKHVILKYHGEFNFSAMNNIAARAASGDVLCLLNNDVEPINGDWLTYMVHFAIQPDVGAVGATLVYPDMSVQHAGVVIGIGGAAGHVFRGVPLQSKGSAAGYGRTRIVSAVTAACLTVERAKYHAVQGLDAEFLKVAFNDVDFCMKLHEHGLKNVCTAEAVLIHHESKSRGSDFLPGNLGRYLGELSILQQRWRTLEYVDSWHHPLFSRDTEQALLGI